MKKALFSLLLFFSLNAQSQWSTSTEANNPVYVNYQAAGAGNYIAKTSDNAGGAIVVFSLNFRSILAQRIKNDGTVAWNTVSNTVAICSTGSNTTNYVAISDLAGGAYIAWADFRNGTNPDIYMQHVNSQGSLSWVANGVRITNTTNTKDENPLLLLNSDSTITVGWTGTNETTGKVETFLQRLRKDGTVIWASNGITVSSINSFKRIFGLVQDANNGAFVLFEDSRNDAKGTDYSYYKSNFLTNIDIYGQRLGASGNLLWTAAGKMVCNATGNQANRTLGNVHSNVSQNGFTAIFQDTRNGNTDIYAQSMDSVGNPIWQNNGVVVSNKTGTQIFQSFTSAKDSVGNLFIAYESGPANNANPIFMTKIDTAGIKSWGTDDIQIDGPTSTIGFTTLGEITTYLNDVYMVYQKTTFPTTTSNFNIYAQKINQSGNLLYGTGGLVICNSIGEQTKPMLIRTTENKFISAWLDNRYSIGNMVFASRFDLTGSLSSKKIYTFIGNGDYSNPLNWQDGTMPPNDISSEDEIIINPTTGACIISSTLLLKTGVKLKVNAGKRLIIQ